MRPVVALALGLLTACSTVVRGPPLGGRPLRRDPATGLYFSTGGSTRPHRTLGLLQVMGFGVEIGGFVDVGDAHMSAVLRGELAARARQAGGDGVLFLEFTDTNPSTPAERAMSSATMMSNAAQGRGSSQKERVVYVTGEIVRFVDP